jgi:Tol biopolymer transport system component
MALTPGTRLGPHEILSAIGAGGMGEVYRARDTRLSRIVAIKVLPTHLADRSELRDRFEREARTIASLNHAHICTLFDIGQQDGVDYLVMEFLEGETLAQRLQKGALPLDQVLQYAIEISDALDKAHRKGVTHRDLKPGNIMLTKSGTKLLDFGLAKMKQEIAPANVQLSQLPTASDPLTAHGSIVGTLQYMAPEQVEAKEVDARTDIFSFGAAVYEMATGRRAFEGKTSASVMAKILEVDPPSMTSLQPMTPPALDRVVKRCLAKEPDSRWQTASDLNESLMWIAEGVSQHPLKPTAAMKDIRSLWRRAPLWGLVCLLAAFVGGATIWVLKPTPPHSVTRAVIDLPPGQRLAGLDNGPAVALSPDGAYLAYAVTQGGSQQLYLRAMDSLEAKPIAGTEGATAPFFSPDGRWIGFLAGGKLKKVLVGGGTTVTLSDASIPRGASWSSQGIIAFAANGTSGLQQVSDAGGAAQPLTRLGKGENGHRWPEFLPNGKAVLFAAGPGGNWNNAQIAVQTLGTGERRNLVLGATQPRYVPSGHLVYGQGGTLMAVPFDSQRLIATGPAVPVVESVMGSTITGDTQYSFSATGSLVYVPGGVQTTQRRLVWVNRNGSEQPLAAPAHGYDRPRISPDGQRVAVGIDEQEMQLWLYDLSRDTLTRLTFEGNRNQIPAWTPDGKRIAFESNKDGAQNIYWQLADGSGGLERLTTSEFTQVPYSWTPDGQALAFVEVNPTTGLDIWVLRVGDPSPGSGQVPSTSSGQVRKAQPFLRTRFNEGAGRFSPDGHWLAYISDESGRYEVFVQSYPGPGGKWQISTEGGTEPVWNRKGQELFYRSGDKMMAVDIATQSGFAAGKPRMLFEGQYAPAPTTSANYDVSPDGQRFLMLKPIEQTLSTSTQINVVLNWFEELKQKAPTGEK